MLLFKLAGSNETVIQPFSPTSWAYVEINIMQRSHFSLCSRYRSFPLYVSFFFSFFSSSVAKELNTMLNNIHGIHINLTP